MAKGLDLGTCDVCGADATSVQRDAVAQPSPDGKHSAFKPGDTVKRYCKAHTPPKPPVKRLTPDEYMKKLQEEQMKVPRDEKRPG